MKIKFNNHLFILFLVVFIMNELLLAQDWANLNRFKDDNKKVGQPSPYENRIVFMGNSITQGWIEQRPQFFSDKPFINRGISGQTTPQMLLRFRQDVVDLNPKVVVILAGTNDIAGNTGPSTLEMILDNLKSMSEISKANGIKVILCSVLPAFDYPWRPGQNPNEKIPQLNKMIENYCIENELIYLDYFSAMVDERNGLPEKYSGDGVHPNSEGYKVMEPLVENAIEKALSN
ncbi:MAG: SGNH/GDSL hydrolase family protein [Ignavibacteriae bacterium]|nr:SGNH/GDSL hydrolase family protein [Ignavibacteriota bacterium]MCB9209074.1 acylhydrolase [Ignavibacteriales bacterium]MCB9218005.1 acylhydrolase [Ignavibacteriales bacterium]MCB9260394.1 acylhydrolase [Ignavibacteriales bacterium]